MELACWTGGLASFIAENHPECTLVGVDRAVHPGLESRTLQAPQSQFQTVGLSQRQGQGPEPADVLLCGLGTNNDCPPGIYTADDSLKVCASKGYEREKQEGLRYFMHCAERPTTMPSC